MTVHTGATNTHFAGCDGNGNVVVLVDGTERSVSGRYEYGPFGEAIRVTGPMGTVNPLRFSTKFTDEETGLVYYGYRYYSPSLGRWINRDPIEEQGGLNLYAFCANNPLCSFDALGNEGTALEQEAAAGVAAHAESGGASQALGFLRQVRQMVDTFNDIQEIASLAMDMFSVADEVFDRFMAAGREVLSRGPSGRMGRWHHTLPEFMGGAHNQTLLELGGGRHESFHEILARHMKAAGLPTGTGGKFDYQEFRKTLGKSAKVRTKAFRALLKATFEFDDQFGGKGAGVVRLLETLLGRPGSYL